MTLLYLIHGHHAWGPHPRFIALSQRLVAAGNAVRSFTQKRPIAEDGSYIVEPVRVELEQVRDEILSLQNEHDRVIAIGHSQGGMICAALASDGLVQGVVSLMGVNETTERPGRMQERYGDGTYTDGAGIRWQHLPGFYADYTEWDTVSLWSQAQCPSLFIAATDDERVPPSEVRLGFDACTEPKSWIEVVGGHDWLQHDGQVDAVADAIIGWVESL